jgi:hypothetical protein
MKELLLLLLPLASLLFSMVEMVDAKGADCGLTLCTDEQG